ncbi:hypothetical protein V8G54_005100 [Vigna mungo]|uniref:Retrotransposon gag domain-containing protein n=1 Tax=Vigna mungo TaxID=3915 RepID=A0AAQ3PEY6_VIGMU
MTQERRKAIWAIYGIEIDYTLSIEVWCRRTDELVGGPNASHITPKALDRWEKRLYDVFGGHPYDMYDVAFSDTVSKYPVDIQSCGGQPFEVELAKPKFKNKENGDYSVYRKSQRRCCGDEIRELLGEEECLIDENFDCIDVQVLVNDERKSTLIENGGLIHPEDVPTHFSQGLWGLELSESPLLSTSPLGQSLKITERSRVKENERSRSKESKRSRQSKHQKAGKLPMVTTRNMENNNSTDMIRELQVQIEAQAKRMEEQAQTIRQQQEVQQKQAEEIARLKQQRPTPEMSDSNRDNHSRHDDQSIHSDPNRRLVMQAPMPNRPPPPIEKFDGTSDPEHHIRNFIDSMVFYSDSDPVKCKAFSLSLKEEALEWYYTLPPNTVDSFRTVITLFRRQYASNRKQEITPAELVNTKQGKDETLKAFMKRYNEIAR